MQCHNFAQAASRLGHRLVVVSRAAPGAPAFERRASGIEVWRVGMPIQRKRLLGRTLDRILHARSVAGRVITLDATCQFDVIETSEAGLDGEQLVRDPRFCRRMVISCHGSNLRGQSIGPFAALHRQDWAWSARRERAVLQRVPTVVVSSEATRQVVLGQGIDPSKVHMIPLGIDTSRFVPACAGREGPLVVGFVGRLEHTKGIEFVWRVLQRLGPSAGIRFRFKGAIHPATKSETFRRLRDFGEFAEYHPPSDNSEMPEFYRSLDALLLPSRFENFGLTYIEAMASGLVVFAGRGGGGPEVVRDNVTGFLVDPDGHVDTVVERLLTLARDRQAFESISLAARDSVVREFSSETFVARKIALYEAIKALPQAAGTPRR